jgi:hypothetical protein
MTTAPHTVHTYSLGSVSRPYVARGWIERALPHGAKYFVNPRIQANTDVDLRNLAKLEMVTSIVETAGSAPEGVRWRPWVQLRQGPAVKKGLRRQKKAGGDCNQLGRPSNLQSLGKNP